MKFFILLFLILLFIYEKIIRHFICIRKIQAYIHSLNGQIESIRKLTAREDIYIVYYTTDSLNHFTVTFNWCFQSTWE